MNLSGCVNELDEAGRQLLEECYRAIDSANYQAALIPVLLQTATLAPTREAREVYDQEAERISTEPFKRIVSYRHDLGATLGTHGLVNADV